MTAADLTQAESDFLLETSEDDQDFWWLIYTIHWSNQDLNLPSQYDLAQSIAKRLLDDKIIECFVVRFSNCKSGNLIREKEFTIENDRVFSVWPIRISGLLSMRQDC